MKLLNNPCLLIKSNFVKKKKKEGEQEEQKKGVNKRFQDMFERKWAWFTQYIYNVFNNLSNSIYLYLYIFICV